MGARGLWLCLLLGSLVQAAQLPFADAQPAAQVQVMRWSAIPGLVEAQIAAGKLPGAVVLVGDRERILYRQAFGWRALVPQREAMTEDSIFDLASLTKAVATTTAVLQLVEQGRLALDAPVASHWPAFAANGKARITLRQLLAHSSGLRPDIDLARPWQGHAAALELIIAERPVAAPGSRVIYSDINFEVLGEIVARVSGLPLDVYCQRHIFEPLRMRDTGFRPAVSARVAPTERSAGVPLRGVVHDPTAARMGGVAGHAGLFGSADDLARFAKAILNGGAIDGARVLQPGSIALLQTAQTPRASNGWRGLGWKLEAPLLPGRERLPPLGAISHTGFTGTAMWIDPLSQRFVIILSNRVHPDGKGDAGPLRSQLVALLANSGTSVGDMAVSPPQLAPHPDDSPSASAAAGAVTTGIDMLEQMQFAPLTGLRIGLITNHTGLDSAGRRTLDVLAQAPALTLAALFSPEHGLYGQADEPVASGMDAGSRLPVYSLYGEVKRPTGRMLVGLDALVFDIQDAGARFYTYITTMAYAMEAAARHGIPIYVLDRPNPIGAERVDGPVLDANLKSFTGYYPLPVRHGMTVGELARLFNQENKIGADLRVIPMQGYARGQWYDQTGLPWTAPSPNLRTLTQATLYPGVALLEGANLSVGRGTDRPFELLGAPWIDAERLASYLNDRQIAGVHFRPIHFQPAANRYAGQRCGGIDIALDDRQALDAPLLGIEIASALRHLYPDRFHLDATLGMIGSRQVLLAIANGVDPHLIAAGWQPRLAEFRALRAHYLLY